VKKYNVPVVAISNDDTGISEDPDVRFAVAKKIVQRAADFGIPAHDIVVDPLVMPIGAMGTAGQQVFALVRRLRMELGVNTTCGASNISFGLPNRHGINAAFLPMAIASGMTSAIMNPVRPQEMEAIRAANLLMANDPHGAQWIKANKPPLAEGEVEEGARGRREGRRRRAPA
jgi:5-methyltetrahydrofolate--homocysteine methyltransferase